MVRNRNLSARATRLMNRIHARSAGRGRAVSGFVSSPEPRLIGQYARGRQLCAGTVLLSGHLRETGDQTLWRIEPPDAGFAAGMHDFAWLDDLAAVGDSRARTTAQTWLWDWIERYGGGTGPGWAPDVTGRRLIRWIAHGLFLLRGREAPAASVYYRSLGRQVRFLSRRWRATRPGLPRFEALSGLAFAGLALDGLDHVVDPAMAALARHADDQIDEMGGIANRNPEHLLEILTLLTWVSDALEAAERPVPGPVGAAVARIAPALRALRHADGGLARFHGGGRGADGRLDHALADSGVRTRPDPERLYMGFGRLAAGRTTLILDAAAPPDGRASAEAHASTLAFELTSGRRPIVVNCGSGAVFGAAWRRAGRATPSHSTLGLEGISSSRLGAPSRLDGARQELLEEVPEQVIAELSRIADGSRIELAHDGWRLSHGLTHARTVDLAYDGRGLAGEDVLTTLSDADRHRFDRAMAGTGGAGVAFAVRFHLHPEVDAEIDLGGSAVSLALPSGEIWVLRHDGAASSLSLAPSVYLEKGRLRPRPTKQVVLSGSAMAYATRVRWSLAKAQDTPNVLRDTVEADPMAEHETEESP